MAFTTIVADPPWPYNDKLMSGNSGFGGRRKNKRGAANHYPTMTLDALRELPVKTVAAPNSHLYLWTTNAFMEEALELMFLWGYSHKTILTWVKPQIGMGHYFRNTTEHVLFGVRGKLRTLQRNVPTAFYAKRTVHSAKPEVFYGIVERMSPGPYLELFARRARPGWVALGDEVNGGRSIEASLADPARWAWVQ